MWFLVIALLTGTGDYDSIVLQMPSKEECRLQMVGVKALDPKSEKYNAECVYIK